MKLVIRLGEIGAIVGLATTTIIAAKENCACRICCWVAHFNSLSIRCTKIIKYRFGQLPEALKTSEKEAIMTYKC